MDTTYFVAKILHSLKWLLIQATYPVIMFGCRNLPFFWFMNNEFFPNIKTWFTFFGFLQSCWTFVIQYLDELICKSQKTKKCLSYSYNSDLHCPSLFIFFASRPPIDIVADKSRRFIRFILICMNVLRLPSNRFLNYSITTFLLWVFFWVYMVTKSIILL